MSNDQGFALKYRLNDKGVASDECNEVFRKMAGGDFMLSPYTQWMVSFEVPPDFIEKFKEEELLALELHLAGRGHYIYNAKARGQNWGLEAYADHVFLGT